MSTEVETILALEPDNPCNTTITDIDTGKVVYTVATQHTDKKTCTYIRNAAGEVIASSEWRDVRSDIITLGQAAPVSSGVWLRKSMIPFKDTIYFTHDKRNFKWKGNGPGLALELYQADDKENPIAKFMKSKRVLNKSTIPPTTEMSIAKLVLDGRGSDISDIVVISFCFLEKSRRAREASTQNRGDVMGTPFGI